MRKITLFYYLEDDTMSLNEERVKNSGLPAGTLVKRHRSETLNVYDLRVGSSVKLFGQTYFLCDADGFTRSYYDSLGSSQPQSLEIPEDAFGRETLARSNHQPPDDFVPLSRTGHVDSSKTIQFLANDGKVCRFFAKCLEESRSFTILFYLADNTVEIRETFPPNSGYDNCSVFFKRGHVSTFRVAQVRIGETVDLVSRKFHVRDADKFTREYFTKTFSITLADAIEEPDLSGPPNRDQEIPPYMGFGSWEDSLGSVKSLNPKPPKRDLIKLYSNEGKILRFFARFAKPCPEDTVRRFVITYYLADDHLMIFEPPIRNSGIMGGKFLEKGVYVNNVTGELVSPSDFGIGQDIEIVRSRFTIEACDEYTAKYLERSTLSAANDSDIESIAQKICEKLYQMMHMIHETFLKVEKNGKAIVTIDKFREILTRFGFFLNETDSLRVMQRFDKHMRGFVSYDEFFSIVAEWGKRGARVPPEQDISIDEYKLITKKAVEEANESDVTRRALIELTQLFQAREGFDRRFMMELGKLTRGAGDATATQIQQALANLGHKLEQGNIDRCVRFYWDKNEGDKIKQRVDIVKFIKNMTVAFYKLTP